MNLKEFAKCTGCDPEAPKVSDPNIIVDCSVNKLNTRVCKLSCATSGMTIQSQNKIKMSCKCPRVNGVRTCGWKSFGSTIDANFISNLACRSDSTTSNVLEFTAGDDVCQVQRKPMVRSQSIYTGKRKKHFYTGLFDLQFIKVLMIIRFWNFKQVPQQQSMR